MTTPWGQQHDLPSLLNIRDGQHREDLPTDFFVSAKEKGLIGPGFTAGRLVAWSKQDFNLGHGHAMAIRPSGSKGWAGASESDASRPMGEGGENDNQRLVFVDHNQSIDRHRAPHCSRRRDYCRADFIVALHAVKPEFEPSWRFISEYAIGRHGWIMKGAFLIWAISCAALSLALWQEVGTRTGKVGVGVLVVVATAMVPAGLFPQEPVTAAPDELTTSGNIHALATMIGIPGLPIAAVLISFELMANE